jgi:hypothetical protein
MRALVTIVQMDLDWPQRLLQVQSGFLSESRRSLSASPSLGCTCDGDYFRRNNASSKETRQSRLCSIALSASQPSLAPSLGQEFATGMVQRSTLFAEDTFHHVPFDEFIVHSSRQNCLTFMIEVRVNYFRATTDT